MKDKAEELYQTFYNLIEHKLNEKYSKYEKDVVNELVIVAENYATEQNKMPSDEEFQRAISTYDKFVYECESENGFNYLKEWLKQKLNK